MSDSSDSELTTKLVETYPYLQTVSSCKALWVIRNGSGSLWQTDLAQFWFNVLFSFEHLSRFSDNSNSVYLRGRQRESMMDRTGKW